MMWDSNSDSDSYKAIYRIEIVEVLKCNCNSDSTLQHSDKFVLHLNNNWNCSSDFVQKLYYVFNSHHHCHFPGYSKQSVSQAACLAWLLEWSYRTAMSAVIVGKSVSAFNV
jgi:hypothetical protein